jgi:Na+/proline symporter
MSLTSIMDAVAVAARIFAVGVTGTTHLDGTIRSLFPALPRSDRGWSVARLSLITGERTTSMGRLTLNMPLSFAQPDIGRSTTNLERDPTR